jgi:hypothetical protein
MKKISFCMIFVAITVVLTGCLSVRKTRSVERRFMDQSLQIQEHSLLDIHHHLRNVSIDGKRSKSGMETTLFGEHNPVVLLPPGIHKISARYVEVSEGTTTITTTTSEQMSIEFDFKAGHIYWFYPIIESKSVRLAIVDETEPLALKSSNDRYEAWHRVKDIKKKLKL